MSDYSQPSASQWIGKSVRRIEDEKLLGGLGRFTDDVSLPGQAHVAFVRSPYAHARIAKIDTSAARTAPGVIAVFTGADVVVEGLGPIPFNVIHKRHDGSAMTVPPRMPLTADVARFVGDAVALVVAETRNQARDAAELVEVDWEPLPAVADLEASARGDAPPVWPAGFTPEHGNLVAYYRMGDAAACAAAMAQAKHVVRLKIVNQRVLANAIEPRSLAGSYDAAAKRFTLYCPTQNPLTVRKQLADDVFKLPGENFHVICTDLGGGFGTRGYAYPEHAALLFAARRTGRPVKWLADRSENFLCEVHGRDNVTEAQLAIGADLKFLALKITTLANVGAYISNFGASVPAMSGARAPSGVYAIPVLDHEVKMLHTNTTPVDAYRGAGRPEMGYLLERLVSRAALELGIDPIELRLKNFVQPAQFPYKNPAGQTYDCGQFERILRGLLAAADWNGFPARRAKALERGKLYGRGIASYIEVTGSGQLTEVVHVTVESNGQVTLISGDQAIGQGIATGLAQVVADRLGVPPESVRVIMGDTDHVKSGGGAGGSRGMQVGGSAAWIGAQVLVEKARTLAARELEAAEADLEYRDARFRIAGTDRSIGIFELAGKQAERRIFIEHSETMKGQTWPNGCQAVEVEVDPDTGMVQLARHTAVDDIGKVVNPLVAEGQMHGGAVQGIGQALCEHSIYDAAGQLLTGSFMDYAMPRADQVPDFDMHFDESVPTAMNPLGAKGVGEAGCHGATPAVVNAVIDALSVRGIRQIDMPLTPERVWRALQGS
ncbi:MAG: xanthine dehydrogenase family protein molybdopterin-binding subunit [Betaproteobacteria bacterium]|nr:xanthine dehydrogenase family protein molybdopterin-binding subunit [Betaproteobacteria bacterium]